MPLYAANGVLLLLIAAVLPVQNSDSKRLSFTVSQQIALGAKPVTRVLQATQDMRSEVVRGGKSARAYLVVRGLSADRPPGVTYDVFLNLPADKRGAAMTPYLVGNINFFETRVRPFVSFDITDRIRGILDARNSVAVTLIPDGEPAPATHPRVERIDLVLVTERVD